MSRLKKLFDLFVQVRRELRFRLIISLSMMSVFMADEEEKGIELDAETITWIVAGGIIVVFVLGVVFQYKILGGIGVNFIQTIVNLPSAILNLGTNVINAISNWITSHI